MAQAHAHGPGIERGAVPGGPDALAARREGNRRRMLVAAAINAALIVAGVIGGILTGSLALLADAGHVLSDLGAIGLALVAAALAARSGGPRRTFGYQRTEVIAALVNGVTLVAIAVLIVVAALDRLGDPPEVEGAGVLVLGVVGLAGNAAATWVLARGQREDLNLEAVLRHSVADALGSLGVIVSGVVDPDDRVEPDRPPGRDRDRGADPRLVGPPGARAAGRPDGGRAAGGGRGCGRPGDRLGGRRARGPRSPRLVADAGIRGACGPRRRRPWRRIAIAPGGRSSSCFGTATGSSTRRSRWRRRPTATPCSRCRRSLDRTSPGIAAGCEKRLAAGIMCVNGCSQFLRG